MFATHAPDYVEPPAKLVLFWVAVLERLYLFAETLRRRHKRSPDEPAA